MNILIIQHGKSPNAIEQAVDRILNHQLLLKVDVIKEKNTVKEKQKEQRKKVKKKVKKQKKLRKEQRKEN